MVDILREQRASNKIIDEAMVEARCLSSEAVDMISKAHETCNNVDDLIITERNHASSRLREERTHHSKESTRFQRNQEKTIEKLHREQESTIKELQSKSDKKYHKVRENIVLASKKLKEQRLIWQKRLSDMNASSKHSISKERMCRRNIVIVWVWRAHF